MVRGVVKQCVAKEKALPFDTDVKQWEERCREGAQQPDGTEKEEEYEEADEDDDGDDDDDNDDGDGDEGTGSLQSESTPSTVEEGTSTAAPTAKPLRADDPSVFAAFQTELAKEDGGIFGPNDLTDAAASNARKARFDETTVGITTSDGLAGWLKQRDPPLTVTPKALGHCMSTMRKQAKVPEGHTFATWAPSGGGILGKRRKTTNYVWTADARGQVLEYMQLHGSTGVLKGSVKRMRAEETNMAVEEALKCKRCSQPLSCSTCTCTECDDEDDEGEEASEEAEEDAADDDE
jgi:hypothetical protein